MAQRIWPVNIDPLDDTGATVTDGTYGLAVTGGAVDGLTEALSGLTSADSTVTITDNGDGTLDLSAPSAGGGGGAVWSQLVTPFRGDGHYLLRTNVGTWSNYNTFATPYGGGGIFNSTHALGDSVAFMLYVDPGTYTLNIFGDASNSRGIVTYEIETAPGSGTYTTLGTIDWYAAAATGFNTRKTLSALTIAGTGGWRNLRCRVTGKNASSSDYYQFLQALQLLRTA
jgi:hypothetical protein